MNKIIIESFLSYKQFLIKTKPKAISFKIKMCNDVINGLNTFKKNIKTEEDIKEFIQFINKKNPKSTIKRIKTILKHGHLPEIKEYFSKHIRDTSKEKALMELSSIYGIGPAKANSLYTKYGIKNIDELNRNKDNILLTDIQLAGIVYHRDLQERIPRKEITEYKNIINNIIKKLDNRSKMCIAGSYRRKKKDSGDIDIILCSKTISIKEIVEALDKFIVFCLAKGEKKTMLLTKLDNKYTVRHMDIILTTPEQYAFAKLYFTGSKEFNIKMRAHALQQNYSLNEYGLTMKQKSNKQIPLLLTEKKIFTFLKYEYVTPQNR